jgi:hypothetical protein
LSCSEMHSGSSWSRRRYPQFVGPFQHSIPATHFPFVGDADNAAFCVPSLDFTCRLHRKKCSHRSTRPQDARRAHMPRYLRPKSFAILLQWYMKWPGLNCKSTSAVQHSEEFDRRMFVVAASLAY